MRCPGGRTDTIGDGQPQQASRAWDSSNPRLVPVSHRGLRRSVLKPYISGKPFHGGTISMEEHDIQRSGLVSGIGGHHRLKAPE